MRKHQHVPPIPTSAPSPAWALLTELVKLMFGVAATAVVYRLAGGQDAPGDLRHLADTATRHGATAALTAVKPLDAAVVMFLTLLITDAVTSAVARRQHTRYINTWYTRKHPENVPTPAVVAYVGDVLKEHGPMMPVDIRTRLNQPGPWGPGIYLTTEGILRALGVHGEPPAWLAPHKPGHPYSHIENPYQPTTTAPDTAPLAEEAGAR